ncbi:zinc-finger of the MIZ type in Nse subunit-domain-containing protein [Hypomontagnella monticulosa]|nr:zinc-finger of the MIZ type in Nse subunit-domain-containing protein [Hypomontagnella monticulosa]
MPLLTGRNRLQSRAERNHDRPNTASQSHGPINLPEYESLSCPLDPTAIRELRQLAANKDTRKYQEQLNKSIELLSGSVRDLNDKYTDHKEKLKALQEKRGEREKNDREEAEEKAVLALKDEVPSISDECDLAVRSVIDMKVELEDDNEALRKTAEAAEAESLNRRRRTRAEDEDEDMEEAEIAKPLTLLQAAKDKTAADYASKSLYEKYGLNNDYIGFKRLWHDAVHGRDGKVLQDASRWFSQNGGDGEADDDDEDLIVAEEHLDIRCPLSLTVMKDPYTSAKCKHTFEKASIVEFLRDKPGRRARCPQTGCGREITISDFHPDPVMLRRIKRVQRESMADDEDDEEDVVDDEGDSQMKVTETREVKSEREGRGGGRRLLEEIEDEVIDDEPWLHVRSI